MIPSTRTGSTVFDERISHLSEIIAAHVTLFHQLPGAQLQTVADRLRLIATALPAPDVVVEDVVSIGRGVAFHLRSPPVDALRRRLVAEWEIMLTPQDLKPGRLHVTVQNKVYPGDARKLLRGLKASFAPTSFVAPGLDLWRYLGGPWERVAALEFATMSAS